MRNAFLFGYENPTVQKTRVHTAEVMVGIGIISDEWGMKHRAPLSIAVLLLYVKNMQWKRFLGVSFFEFEYEMIS